MAASMPGEKIIFIYIDTHMAGAVVTPSQNGHAKVDRKKEVKNLSHNQE